MTEWLEKNVVGLLKHRLKNNRIYINTSHNNKPSITSISIMLNELPVIYHMEFDKTEFKINKNRQFKKLARMRRLMLADEMHEAAKELTTIANKLSR